MSPRDFIKGLSVERWIPGITMVKVAQEWLIEYRTPYRPGIGHRISKTLAFAENVGFDDFRLTHWAGHRDWRVPTETFNSRELARFVATICGPEIAAMEKQRRIIWHESARGSARDWLKAHPPRLRWLPLKFNKGGVNGFDPSIKDPTPVARIGHVGSVPASGKPWVILFVRHVSDLAHEDAWYHTRDEAIAYAEKLWVEKGRPWEGATVLETAQVGEAAEGSAREWLKKSGYDSVPAFRIYGPHQVWVVARSGKVLKYCESEFIRQGLVDAERFNVEEYLSRETPASGWGSLPDIKLDNISFWGPGGTYRKSYSEIS